MAALRPAFALLDQFVTRHMAETGAPGLTLSLADALGLLRASVPKADGTFGVGDTEAPDRVGFKSIVADRAMRMNYSGVVFRGTFTP